MADDAEDSPQETFISHLVELRDRLLHAIIAVLVLTLCLVPWAKDIYSLLADPLLAALPAGATMIATDVTGTFLVPLKVTLMTGFLIALPYVLYQAWAFVAPGLYSHEKRFMLPLVVSSTLLFFVGVAFCYFLVLPAMSQFIQLWAPKSITAAPDIEQYFGFVLTLFVVFGLAFEVPIVVIVLARLGVVPVDKLRAFRGYFIVLAFIIAAVVTPPDVISQLALAIPMVILYEVGLRLASLFEKKEEAEAEPEPERKPEGKPGA